MIERTQIAGAFKGIRGRRPIDSAALEQLLVRFSWLVAEQTGRKPGGAEIRRLARAYEAVTLDAVCIKN
jgi:hypothetical protein